MLRFTIAVLVLSSTATLSLGSLNLWHKQKLEFIDNSNVPDSSFAKAICDNVSASRSQIRHISTIIKLASSLNSFVLPGEKDCLAEFGESIVELEKVVTVSNANVCSDEKISAIEGYHKKFISKLSEDKPNRKEAPKILKKFFTLYALQVSQVCKRNVVRNLEEVAKRFKEDDYTITSGNDFMGKFSKQLANLFQSVSSLTDVLLIWDVATVSSEKDTSKKYLTSETDQETSEPVRMIFVTRSAPHLKNMQRQCRNRFRPVYSKTIMPAVRLANLGYVYTDEALDKEEKHLNEKELVLQWYRMAQFCETINPMKIIQSEKAPKNNALVITPEESKKYLEEEPLVELIEVPKFEYEPEGNSLEALETLSLAESEAGQKLAKNVKVSRSGRVRQIKKALAKFIRTAKSVAKGQMHFSHKAACKTLGEHEQCNSTELGFVKRDIEQVIDSNAQEIAQLERDADEKDTSRASLLRRKRETSVLGIIVLPVIALAFIMIVGAALNG